MRIRLLALLLAMIALLGACGGGGGEEAGDTDAASSQTESEGEGGAEGEGEGAAEGEGEGAAEGGQSEGEGAGSQGQAGAQGGQSGSSGGSGSGSGSSGGSNATPAPVQQAKPGAVNEPKLGKYVFHVTGKASNPFATPNPTNPNQSNETQVDRDTTQEFVERKQVDKGVEFTQRSGGQQGSQTSTYRWEADKILLTRLQFSGQQGSVDCKYNTPQGGLFMTVVPVKAGQLPKQEWSNDQCSGTHEVNIIGQEDVTDETGKTWKTWKAQVKTMLKIPAQQVEALVDQTVWLSPDLGWQIKSDGKSDIKFGAASFNSDTKSVLKSHP